MQARLDPSGSGLVQIAAWLDVAQKAMCGQLTPGTPEEHHQSLPAQSQLLAARQEGAQEGTAPSKQRWEILVVLIWFALDQRETGELQTNSFVAWLRRVAAAPSNPAVELSDVYLMINRGFKYLPLCPLARFASALRRLRKMILSLSSRWLKIKYGAAMPHSYLERLMNVANEREHDAATGDGQDSDIKHREEELESIPTDWTQLTSHDGKGSGDANMMLGNPCIEPDGVKTLACLHFQTTVKDRDAAAHNVEIIEIACVLVNRNNLRIVDEFHSFVRPQHVPGYSKLFYAMTSANTERVDAEDGFCDVWRRLEEWLMQRNVLDKDKRCWKGNPTVFVVDEPQQLASILPLQLRLSGKPLPEYLEDWLDLNLLLKRHFRCGKCSGCSTRIPGRCRTKVLVPQMMQLVRSEHWDDFAKKYRKRKGGDDEALIDLAMYGVEAECFESTLDRAQKDYKPSSNKEMTTLHGHLYKLKDYARSPACSAGSHDDSLMRWQLRLFKMDGYELSFVQENGAVDFRLLKLGNIVGVTFAPACAQEFAFEIEFLDAEVRSEFVLLAAESSSERHRWVQGLLTAAAIHKEVCRCVCCILSQDAN